MRHWLAANRLVPALLFLPLLALPQNSPTPRASQPSADAVSRADEALRVLSVNWSAPQQKNLDVLEHATRSYLSMRGFEDSLFENPDQNRSLLAAQEEAGNAAFCANILTALRSMESGRLPAAASLGAAQADAQLNSAYRGLMDRLRSNSDPNRDLLPPYLEQRAESRWIDYRDAWTALLRTRYPKLDTPRWAAQMTVERTQILKKLMDALPPVDPKAEAWLAVCARARTTPLPSLLAVPPGKPATPTCYAYKSYYGVGASVDYPAALQCAVTERNAIRSSADLYPFLYAEDENGQAINGPLMLAMLYANGQGVPRNLPLAERLTCEAIDDRQIDPIDPDQYKGGISAFFADALKKVASAPTSPVDLCGFAPWVARLEDECDAIQRTRTDLARNVALNAVSAAFTPAQKAAYDRLLAALRTYLASHDDKEIEVPGHFVSSGAWQGLQPDLERRFLRQMGEFEHGGLPRGDLAARASAEHDLQAALATVLSAAANDPENLPDPAGIRSTQQLWIAYRDAFADFGGLRYPGTTRDAWLTYVTRQRTRDLGNPCFLSEESCGQPPSIQ